MWNFIPSKITLFRTEKIRERDGVKILSKSIVLENNLPTQKPSQLRELVIPGIQSTHALTMNCETGKVHICFPKGNWMYLRFQIIIGHGTRTVKKSSSRFARVCGKNAKRLDQRRKKSKSWSWQNWKGRNGLEGKGLFGSAMIQKAFSSSGESWDSFMIHFLLYFQCWNRLFLTVYDFPISKCTETWSFS